MIALLTALLGYQINNLKSQTQLITYKTESLVDFDSISPV